MITILYSAGAIILFALLVFLDKSASGSVELQFEIHDSSHKELIFFILALVWPVVVLSVTCIWISSED